MLNVEIAHFSFLLKLTLSGVGVWRLGEERVCHFLTEFFSPNLAETKMSQQKNNQKVACNLSNLPPLILVSIFSFLLLLTGAILTIPATSWPPEIETDLKKQFPTFRTGYHKSMKGGGGFFTPPPPPKIGLKALQMTFLRCEKQSMVQQL